MNTSVIPVKQMPSLQMDESDLMNVLKNSLYPGAKTESIKLVISYCKASGLDPMQKPVHIVPMQISTGKKGSDGWDEKEWRDVIMPGIGLYRTQAARGGEYAGVTEPEFGDDVTTKLGDTDITYPKWCKITVKRLMPNGAIVDFTAKELWLENYATKSAKVKDPNAMWKRRPYAQLAKCAEAQALRKAFPEFGAQPTADEMEGKTLEEGGTVIDNTTQEISTPAREIMSTETFNTYRDKWKSAIENGKKSVNSLIAWIEGKGTDLTPEQKIEIASWEIKQTTGEEDAFA